MRCAACSQPLCDCPDMIVSGIAPLFAVASIPGGEPGTVSPEQAGSGTVSRRTARSCVPVVALKSHDPEA